MNSAPQHEHHVEIAGAQRQSRRLGTLSALWFGARLALTGGRDNAVRTALMAVGIGLGVAMLLVAASIPTVRQHRDERIHARIDVNLGDPPQRSDRTVLVDDIDTVFQNKQIRGRMVEPEGASATLPPGAERYPGPGEMIVSPALRQLLDAPGNSLLRQRLDYPIVGEIAEQGLLGPGEYVYYLGGHHMANGVAGTRRLDHFGKVYAKKPLPPQLVLFSVAGIVVLLAPVAVFIAAAVRFGSELRNRRLAALRLFGADRSMTAGIAAGETMASALAGVVLGAILFMVGRQFVGQVDVQGLSVFTDDLSPQPFLAVLTVVAVLMLSLVVTRMAMNTVVVEPLSVVRRSAGRARRLWWRLAVPLLGLMLLRVSLPDASDIGDATGIFLVVVGMLTLLAGVTAVLPWFVERLTGVSGGFGPLSWQLAVGRLCVSSDAATRSVNGITVAVAGALALQVFFTGITHQSGTNSRTTHEESVARTHVGLVHFEDGKEARGRYASSFARTPGVRQAVGFADLSVREPGAYYAQTVRIADCAQLRLLASLHSCSDGDAFVVVPRNIDAADDMVTWKAGRLLRIETDKVRWKTPHITATVPATSVDPQGAFPQRMLLSTPGAAGAAAAERAVRTVGLTYTTSTRDTEDRIRTVAAQLDPAAAVELPEQPKGDVVLRGIQRALLAGAMAVLLLIGASLLLGALEQLRERRRVLAVLVAFGTRRLTLAASVLWQTAIPVALGLLVAGIVGAALGSTLLGLVGRTAVYDWGTMLVTTGLGAVAVVAVTLLTLPTLWRSTRAEGLRHE